MNKRKVFKKVFWKDWPNKPCTYITKGKFFVLEYKYMYIDFHGSLRISLINSLTCAVLC